MPEHTSSIYRYYYAPTDHAINPSWTPDGQRLLFVSNREVAYGTGDIWSVAVNAPEDLKKIFSEETAWRAQPQVAPDGRRVLFSSYHGRQWQQLWLTTMQGAAPLPLTFGEFDRTQARFSPDGSRIGYISNEDGNTSLWVQEIVGGARTRINAAQRSLPKGCRPLPAECARRARQKSSGASECDCCRRACLRAGQCLDACRRRL